MSFLETLFRPGSAWQSKPSYPDPPALPEPLPPLVINPPQPRLGRHTSAEAQAERATHWGEIAALCMIQGHILAAEKAGKYAAHWARLALGHTF